MKTPNQPFSMNNYSIIQQLASKPLSFNKGNSSRNKVNKQKNPLFRGLLPKKLLRESHLIFS